MTDTATIGRIRLAMVLVSLEALALLVFGVVELARLDRDRPTIAVTTTAFFFLYAAGLALAARGLVRLRTWSRGPVVLAQFIQLGVAWSFHGRATDWVAALLALLALVVLVIVFAPSTTTALYGGGDPDGPVVEKLAGDR